MNALSHWKFQESLKGREQNACSESAVSREFYSESIEVFRQKEVLLT